MSPRRSRRPVECNGPADDTPTDPVEIFRVLNGHAVDYLIIGGVAVQAYGHVRTTQDVDVIVAPDMRNLERLAAALSELGARPKGVDAHLPGIDPTDATHLRAGRQFWPRHPSWWPGRVDRRGRAEGRAPVGADV